MMYFLLAFGVIIFVFLLFVSAVRANHSALSPYELHRRKEAGDPGATELLRRENLLVLAEMLKQPISALLLAVLAVVEVAVLNWGWGLIAVALTSLFYTRLSNFSIVHRLTQKLYQSHEVGILKLIERRQKIIGILMGSIEHNQHTDTFSSREELFHQISNAKTVLSTHERQLLTHALAFTQRRAIDVMTSRNDIVTIEHTEMLGPLVLSDLHNSGHSCFPIIARNPDHIVGMLDIRGLLTLETKRTVTAAKAMTGNAYYIRGDQTLDHALAAFIRTRHHLLIVIDKDGATLGILSLRDVLEALLGRPLADEFASDTDLRLVTKRHL